MIPLIRLQSRRILFSTLMLGLILLVFPARYDGGVHAALYDQPIIYALIILIVCTGFAVLLAALLPLMLQIPVLREFRTAPEFFLPFVFLQLAVFAPLFSFLPAAIAPAAPLATFMIYWGIVQGPLLDKLDLHLGLRGRRSFVTKVDRAELWERLRPGRGPIDRHWEPLLAEATQEPQDPARFDLRYKLGGGVFEHQEITYRDETPMTHVLYSHSNPVAGARGALVSGDFEIWLEDAGEGRTRVTVENRRAAMRPAEALAQWFDNYHGDKVLFARNLLEKRWDGTLSGYIRRKITSLA